VRIDGIVSANGSNGVEYAAGGSGGAIYITCRYFEGTGTLRANGGSGASAGGAGGGRIAVWRVFGGECTATVNGGPTADAAPSEPGEPGSIVWGSLQINRFVIRMR
jgi:hypothetical protein